MELEDYASAVCCYISKCMDEVTVTRRITIRPNQKPWLNGKVGRLLKTRDAAFRSADTSSLSTARRNLEAGIKIQGHFSPSGPRSMWKGIKTITDYSKRDAECPWTHLSQMS